MWFWNKKEEPKKEGFQFHKEVDYRNIHRCIGIVGTNGTGKTCTEEEMIQIWIRQNPKRLIHGYIPDPGSVLHRYVTNPIAHGNPDWARPLEEAKNSLIVLDDYVGLMQSKGGAQLYTPTPGMTNIFTKRRFYNNELIFSCHSPSAVIPQLVQFISHFVIFKTSTDQGKFQGRFDGWAQLEKAARMVNWYCEQIGHLGKHSSDPKYNGQGFPRILFDNTSKRSYPINMRPELYKQFEYYDK